MNSIANNIKHRLSLREPLQDALDVVATLVEKLKLTKEVDLQEELLKVKALFPSCADFERDFPSIAFSIATGVGKTRLMGACIAYLYLEKGIRNFFILAPNLTIYEKLIEDFGNPAYPKYVFNGITEFVHNRPIIITGDNYSQQGSLFGESEIRINIFNISKFNSENKGSKKAGVTLAPRIKRLSEYLGQSYWEYLSGLTDLVVLMDEAHRYHADASKNAINELQPVLGLELTATPKDEKGAYFKNVVFEYSLAQALTDGKYVKSPAIAKRKDFNAKNIDERQLEIIKLEDAVSIHLDTKQELEVYALNEETSLVKPFILVVCRDTSHAKEIFELINSVQFYDGEFQGKVLQIDSTTRRDEDIEKQFISLENPLSPIEIVIHVNMLKEGWDVANLYTIVPLRAANAAVLVEQTIGRGLRLPYNGRRTGVDKIDKLTVVAHENFDAVIEAASDPDSVLNKVSFIEFSTDDLDLKSEVITAPSVIVAKLNVEQANIRLMNNEEEKQVAQNVLDAKKAIIDVLPDFNKIVGLGKVEDLKSPNIKRMVITQIANNLSKGQGNLFASQILTEVEMVFDTMVTDYKNNIIEIPRMDLVQADVEAYFEDFELETTNLSYQALDQEIIRMGLRDKLIDTLSAKSSGFYGNPVKLIIAEIINYPEIDYDENADLLYKLATQACDALKSNLPDAEQLNQVVFQFKSAIAEKIFRQMKSHLKLSEPEYLEPRVFPFVRIEPWNFTAVLNGGFKDYRDVITPTSSISKFVFRGFEKACHFEYKFDSKTEQDFAFILENDKAVLKWLRPSPNQFRLYWDNNSKRYEPDFVVETKDSIYLIETKMSSQMEVAEVRSKKEAAERYCEYSTKFTAAHGGKPWKYVILPHNKINRTATFSFLTASS